MLDAMFQKVNHEVIYPEKKVINPYIGYLSLDKGYLSLDKGFFMIR